MLPNFLIVGVQKGGTTSLQSYLTEHPDVFVAPHEIHFFGVDKNSRMGVPWYENHFREWKGQTAIGEKGPSYSYFTSAPSCIAQVLPQARLIWIFRNPADRAYSQYWHSVSKGKEGYSFEKALELEKSGRRAYVARGRYSEQVERFLTYFSRERMLFLLQEELHRAPASVMRRICRFLEVNPDYQFQRLNEKANVTWRPRSILLQRLGFKVYSRLQYGYRGYQLIRTLNSRSKPGYPLMKPATCRTLTEYFAPHNHRLEQLTGLDLTLWNQTVSEGSQADDSDTTVTAEDLDGIP